jgi:hypothetical protein
MAKCDVPTLVSRTSGFANMLTPGMRPLARVALLTSILQRTQPSFTPNLATINSLLASAKCFTCLSPGEQQVMKVQLLCEILNAPGVPGGTAPTVSIADPFNNGSSTVSFLGTPTDSSMTVVLVQAGIIGTPGLQLVKVLYGGTYGSARTVSVTPLFTPPTGVVIVVQNNTNTGFTITANIGVGDSIPVGTYQFAITTS